MMRTGRLDVGRAEAWLMLITRVVIKGKTNSKCVNKTSENAPHTPKAKSVGTDSYKWSLGRRESAVWSSRMLGVYLNKQTKKVYQEEKKIKVEREKRSCRTGH